MTAACGRKGNKFKFGEAWFRRYAKRHGFPMEIAHKIPTITPEYLWPEKVFKDAKQTVGEDVDQSDDTNDDDEWSNLNGQPQKCKSRWAQPPEDHKYTRLDAAPPQNHKKPREISWTMPSLKRNKKTGEIVWDLPSEHNNYDQVARSQQVNKKSQPQTNHSQSSASALKRKQDYVWTEPSEERKMSGDQERDDSNLGEKRVRFRSRGVVTPALPSFHRVPQIYDRHAKGPDVNSRRVHSSQALANNTGRATSPDFDDEQRASPVARLGGTTRKGDLTRTEPTLKLVEVLTKSVGASPVNSLVLSSERNDSNLGEKRVRFRSRGVVTPALPSFHRVPQIYDRHAKGPDVNTGAFANNTGRATPPSFGDEERLTAFSRVADVNNKEGTSGVGKERHPPSPRRFVSNNNSRSQIKSPKLNELQRTSPPSVRAPSPLKFISTQDQATDLIHQFKQTSERREMLVGASALMEISLSPISDLLHSSANNEEGSRFSPVDLTVNNSPNESDNNDGRDGDRAELDGSKESGQTDGDRVEQIEQLDGSKESGGRADADHVEPDGSKESGQTDGDRVELDGSKESGHSKLCRFQTADDFAQNGRHCRRDSYLYDLRDLHRSVPLIVVDLSSQDGITIYNSLERQYMATRQSFLHNRIVLLPLVPGDQQEKYHSAYAAGLGCKQAQPNEYGGNREQDATLDSFVDACIDSAIREIRKLSSPAVVQERIVRPLYEAPKNPSTLSTVLRLIREHISVPSEMYVFNAGADVPLKIVRGGLPGPDTILLVSCEDRDEAIWYTTIPNCCCSDGSFAEQCSQSHDSNMCHTTSGFIASRDDVQVNDHASSSNKRRQTQVNDHASSSNKRRQTTSSSASRDDVQVNNHGSSSNKKRKTTSSSASGGVRREGTENIQSIRSQIAPDEDYGMLYGEAIGCFKEAVNPTNPNNVEVLNAHLINPQRLVARAFVEVVTSTSECASLLVCIHDGDNQIQRRGGFARIVRASAIAAGLFDDWNEDEQCPNDPDGQDLIDNVVVFATNYTQEIGNGTKLLDHYRDFLHRTAIRSEDRQRWGSFSVTAESDIDGDNDIILLRDQYLAHLEMARRPDFEGDQFFMSLVGYYFRANTVFITCSPYSVEYYDHKGEELSTARRLVVICDTRSKLQFYTVIQVADLGCEDA